MLGPPFANLCTEHRHFAGQMPFPLPNQQWHSIEGTPHNKTNTHIPISNSTTQNKQEANTHSNGKGTGKAIVLSLNFSIRPSFHWRRRTCHVPR